MTKVAAAIWYHYECGFFLSWYENGGKWSRAGLMFMEELSELGEHDKPKGEKILVTLNQCGTHLGEEITVQTCQVKIFSCKKKKKKKEVTFDF